MMHCTFVSLFPHLIEGYFQDSILRRAIENGQLSVSFVNPRDFALNKYGKVDDTIVGGGAGMLLDAPTLHNTLQHIDSNAYIIIPQPSAKRFSSQDAKRLSRKKHLVFIAGRYEGIDERVIEKYADEVLSLGDFVLTGGELASLCMCDAIARHIDGVLGNDESLFEESFEEGLLEAPSFTKPNVFENSPVVSEFLKGNHGKIRLLKNRLSLDKTQFHRPDLFKRYDNKDRQ